MKKVDREIAHRQLDGLFDRAPSFGEVTFITHFRDGRVCNFNKNISYSILAEPLRSLEIEEVKN
jgi:hypothetical protein